MELFEIRPFWCILFLPLTITNSSEAINKTERMFYRAFLEALICNTYYNLSSLLLRLRSSSRSAEITELGAGHVVWDYTEYTG